MNELRSAYTEGEPWTDSRAQMVWDDFVQALAELSDLRNFSDDVTRDEIHQIERISLLYQRVGQMVRSAPYEIVKKWALALHRTLEEYRD